MARFSIVKDQLIARLKRSLKRSTTLTLVDDSLSDGSPALVIKSGATAIAYVAVQPRSFNGFNVVAELSSAAGEGYPEHVVHVYFDTDAAGMDTATAAQIAMLAGRIGASSMAVYQNTTAPSNAVIIAANLVYEIANTDEAGAVGA
jgi:hypothetical protein